MKVITFLTSQRLNFFIETVNTLIQKCKDLKNVDLILHYDDSSNSIDRIVMNDLLHRLFPDKLIMEKYFERESFLTGRRSMEIMNQIQKDLTLLNVEYFFHIEDDWKFIEDFTIQDGIDILKNNNDIGYIGYHYPYKNKITELYGKRPMIGDYWEILYFPNQEDCCNLFLDEEEMAFHNTYDDIPDFWCYFINWPPYSFRPGITDLKKINNVGTFDYKTGTVELEFAKKFSKKYKGYSHIRRKCVHLGQKLSAFNINNSIR